MKRFFKGIVKIFKDNENEEKECNFIDICEMEFQNKVRQVMKNEKDFSPLYDIKSIMNMSKKEQLSYLSEITRKYIFIKEDILRQEENAYIL